MNEDLENQPNRDRGMAGGTAGRKVVCLTPLSAPPADPSAARVVEAALLKAARSHNPDRTRGSKPRQSSVESRGVR